MLEQAEKEATGLSVHLPPVKHRASRVQRGHRNTGKGSNRAPGAEPKAGGKAPSDKGKDKAGKGGAGKDKGKGKDQHKGKGKSEGKGKSKDQKGKGQKGKGSKGKGLGGKAGRRPASGGR